MSTSQAQIFETGAGRLSKTQTRPGMHLLAEGGRNSFREEAVEYGMTPPDAGHTRIIFSCGAAE